jgi:TRAP transporter TAXI family solute receptor
MKRDGRPIFRPGRCCCLFAATLCAAVLFNQQSFARPRSVSPAPNVPPLDSVSERINANTIAIVSGNPNGTYLAIAYDLSAVLNDGTNFRVLPVIGEGGGQNIKDVRFLKGVDLGITQVNLLHYYKRNNEIGPIDDKIVYIAKLFNEEMHLIVRADGGITSIEQLAGKRVNFSDVGSGTQLATGDIFARLGIKAEEVNMGQADAFEKLKSGEIAASVLIAGKPAASIGKLKAAEGFRILPMPYPKPLQDDYLPAKLTSEDYPGLIAPGQEVETVAAGTVLIAYNWPKDTDRYRRIELFVEKFFPRLADFRKPPRHLKWRETNLATVLPGWKRFGGAEEWLRNRANGDQAERSQFDQFLAKRPVQPDSLSSDERARLFQQFQEWSKPNERRLSPRPGEGLSGSW